MSGRVRENSEREENVVGYFIFSLFSIMWRAGGGITQPEKNLPTFQETQI